MTSLDFKLYNGIFIFIFIVGPRECHTMDVFDDKLVLFGGNDQQSRMNELHVLDTS